MKLIISRSLLDNRQYYICDEHGEYVMGLWCTPGEQSVYMPQAVFSEESTDWPVDAPYRDLKRINVQWKRKGRGRGDRRHRRSNKKF